MSNFDEHSRADAIAELISLALTVPTLILATLVIVRYLPKVFSDLRGEERMKPDVRFLIIGITISFIGAFMDNLYWGIAWALHFFEIPTASYWFDNGVYSNIPFRQCAGILAAVFHLWAFMSLRWALILVGSMLGALFLLLGLQVVL